MLNASQLSRQKVLHNLINGYHYDPNGGNITENAESSCEQGT